MAASSVECIPQVLASTLSIRKLRMYRKVAESKAEVSVRLVIARVKSSSRFMNCSKIVAISFFALFALISTRVSKKHNQTL